MSADQPPSVPLTAVVSTTWRRRFSPRPGWQRLQESWIAVLQVVLAASAAYFLAHAALGHPTPLQAVAVAISSLGLTRDARPLRVLETVAAMLSGIVIAEFLRLAFGTGIWQLAVVLAVTMLLARFVMPSPQFAIGAGIQAAIAMLLPAGPAPFVRLLDGVIGGVFALLVTALLPRNPMGALLRDARELFSEAGAATERVIQGLERGDLLRADRGLEKARSLQGRVEAWNTALESAQAVSALSPFLRSRRSEIARQQRILRSMDLATRNLRVIARRAAYLARDRQPRPVGAGLLRELQEGMALVGVAVGDPRSEELAQTTLTRVAERLDPEVLLPNDTQGTRGLVASLRPFVVDLLQAAGLAHDEAASRVPRI